MNATGDCSVAVETVVFCDEECARLTLAFEATGTRLTCTLTPQGVAKLSTVLKAWSEGRPGASRKKSRA